jgi:tetratricopeptide (TPR) repeat protein
MALFSFFSRFSYELDVYKNALQIREFYPEKNPHECKIKKEYGNKAYQEGKDIEALHFYTQAVIAAPCDEKTGKSKELSVALANRSAVLFSLKAFALALDDIRLALESGYPEDLHFKLLERKAKILMYFKQFSDAQKVYKDLVKSLDNAKIDSTKKLKVQKDAQAALTYFQKAPSVYNDPNVVMKDQLDLPKIPDKNKKYPALSHAVCFKYEPGRGRFAIAQREIKVGEFICVESPIVSHPLPEYMGSNCSHCFKAMKAPLPCPVCSKVLFCSYNCREKALSTYHPYECKIFDFLIASGISIVCFLAYKAMVQKPASFFLENRDKFVAHDEASGVNIQVDKDGKPLDKYLSNDYRNYFNLVTHHSERKVGDIFHRAMLTVMFLRCMKKYGYFGPEAQDEVLTDDECFVASILCHFLEVNQFNAHEVAQV